MPLKLIGTTRCLLLIAYGVFGSLQREGERRGILDLKVIVFLIVRLVMKYKESYSK